MHRKTTDYLDEIGFWYCARSRLLHRAAQLRDNPEGLPPPRPPTMPASSLDELLQRCGLGTLWRCSDEAPQGNPEGEVPDSPRDPQA